MRQIEKDFFFETYADYFEGHEILFKRNVFTNEVFVVLNDELAQSLGFNSLNQMMADDEVLDRLNEYKKTTGEFPIKHPRRDINFNK